MQIADDDSGVLLTNTRGVILDANPRACAMFGYAREELVYTNVIKLLHPDELKKILRRKESPGLWAAPSAPREMVRQDGSRITVEGRSRFIHKSKQMLILRDITDRIRAEETIQATNRRMLDILDSISDSFLVLDLDFRFKFINKRAAALIGARPEDVIGRSLWDTSPGLFGPRFEDNYKRAMRDRVPVLFEAETPEGRWVEVRIYPTLEGLTIYGTDVTARKRAEERLWFAIESAPLMILEWTRELGERRLAPPGDGSPNISGTRAGPAALEPIHPDDRERVAEERRRAIERGGDSTLEFRLVRPDGSVSWVSNRVRVARGPDGDAARITDVFIDITERKQLEEEVFRLKLREAGPTSRTRRRQRSG